MGTRINGVVIDGNDLDPLAGFWSGLLGPEVTRSENDWISLGPHLALQLVPERKTVKNRIHLDLVTDHFAATVARERTGATPVKVMQEDLWQVWQDPEGNDLALTASAIAW